MKLKCIRDVVMSPSGEVAFKAGEEYEFGINSSGELYRFTNNNNTMHMFRAHGPDAWSVYFKYVLEVA